jgi:endo-1,4-beta-xylanase
MKNPISSCVGLLSAVALMTLCACATNEPAAPAAIPNAAPFAQHAGVVSGSFPIPDSVPLWPGGAPGSEGKTSPEVVAPRHELPGANGVDSPDVTFRVVSNINNPSITPFLPDKSIATGAAVIVMPGGGHMFLSIDMEGYDVAHYLSQHGVAAFVLKYRLARSPGSTYKVEVESLMDTQRAIRTVRANAVQWGVDPNRIGVMGFSAGGQLAFLAGTRYNNPVKGSNEPVDQLSCRPNFQALMYASASNNVVVDKASTPPTFLCCTATDIHPDMAASMCQYYAKLFAAHVPAELHIYAGGAHGWGTRPTGRPVSEWPDRFLDWMSDTGLLKSAPTTAPAM